MEVIFGFRILKRMAVRWRSVHLRRIRMAETVKKRQVAAEPRLRTTAKRKAGPRLMKPAIVLHEEIEKLAHRFWAERGYQHGSAEVDWFRAERELRGRAS